MPESRNTDLLTVEAAGTHTRLDTYLQSCFPKDSRAAMQRLIDSGNVTLNGKKVKQSQRVRIGDRIVINWPTILPSHSLPEAIPLEILFEDSDLLVVNKPAGLVVHPAVGHEEHTLVNAVLHHCRGRLSGIGGVARPGIVHRLDKDTSGCLVVAKSDFAHLALAEQFEARAVEKVYSAITCGALRSSSGEISAAIARHPTHRKRMAVSEGEGRAALTTYRVVERFSTATFVEARLHTGRTHQIRVHFHHLGAPLLGDQTYGKRQTQRIEEQLRASFPRQMLHARLLSFAHPSDKRAVVFEAPFPADFCQALQVLRDAEP